MNIPRWMLINLAAVMIGMCVAGAIFIFSK